MNKLLKREKKSLKLELFLPQRLLRKADLINAQKLVVRCILGAIMIRESQDAGSDNLFVKNF